VQVALDTADSLQPQPGGSRAEGHPAADFLCGQLALALVCMASSCPHLSATPRFWELLQATGEVRNKGALYGAAFSIAWKRMAV